MHRRVITGGVGLLCLLAACSPSTGIPSAVPDVQTMTVYATKTQAPVTTTAVVTTTSVLERTTAVAVAQDSTSRLCTPWLAEYQRTGLRAAVSDIAGGKTEEVTAVLAAADRYGTPIDPKVEAEAERPLATLIYLFNSGVKRVQKTRSGTDGSMTSFLEAAVAVWLTCSPGSDV